MVEFIQHKDTRAKCIKSKGVVNHVYWAHVVTVWGGGDGVGVADGK